MIQETDIFLNTDDFATPAVVTPKGSNSGRKIVCIFYEKGTPQDSGNDVIITTQPEADCADKDSSDLIPGSTFIINTVTYYVERNLPLGNGWNKLALSKDPV